MAEKKNESPLHIAQAQAAERAKEIIDRIEQHRTTRLGRHHQRLEKLHNVLSSDELRRAAGAELEERLKEAAAQTESRMQNVDEERRRFSDAMQHARDAVPVVKQKPRAS
ncbi:MAG: hypothetical protein M3Q69_02625 [Acidobacteriota bacterium]|nr:hypothetical protein [Acidobacteriota bacterium]